MTWRRRHVLRGRLVTPEGVLADGVVAIDDARISWLGGAGEWGDADGWPAAAEVEGTILPGLVDVHCHGAAGFGFPDADQAGARAAAAHHRAHGTTTLVASLVTAPEAELLAALDVCAGLVESGAAAAIHLEGPFLSPARAGAQDPAALRDPDLPLLDRLLDAGRGHVRTLTYAPELVGAPALASRAIARGVVPCIGHTDSDARTARAALAAAAESTMGRSAATHLFNGMPVLHSRAPGPVAAALAAAARGEAVVELVADGVHLAPDTVAAVFDLVGPGQIALVTDAMPAAGMPGGRYRLGRLDVEVSDGVARLAGEGPAESRSIAGGTARLVDVLRRTVRDAGVGLPAAVTAATATPARLLGLGEITGALRPGLRADLLVVDDALHPVRVMSAGRWAPEVDT
jgi:N-acetylglucosamine-6-phosphate deacetylase